MSGPGATDIIGWQWRGPAEPPPALSRERAGSLLAAAGWVAAALALTALAGFFVFVRSIDRDEREPATRSDGIVVLTGGAERIGDAIDLLARGYGGRLLISGVNERTSRDEIARLNPRQRRLVECCVDLDYRARNTIGNAIETRRWVRDNRFHSVIVVTSNYHMPRTLVELDHVLPKARVVPYPVVSGQAPDAWWRHATTTRLLVSEYAKFLAGWVRTRFEGDPEGSESAVLTGGRPGKMVEGRQRR